MISRVEGTSIQMEGRGETNIQDIPPEVLTMILDQLPIAEIGNASLVQRQWNNLRNDALQNSASFFGYEKKDSTREEFLRELFSELKDLCNKGMIPEHLIVYHDEEKTKIAYEETLANCRNLSKSEIVDLMHHESYFFTEQEVRNYYPLFTHFLLKNGNFSKEEVFLDKDTGFFVMQDCVQTGSIEGVELLVKCGVDPSYYIHCPLLLTAIRQGHIEIVCLLLSYNIDVNATTNQEGFTALHIAAFKGDIEVIKLLLKSGATLKAGGPGIIEKEPFSGGGNSGVMPSWIAGLKGHKEVAELLEECEKRA